MSKVIEAIYNDGKLELFESLGLPDRQRVRVTVEPIESRPKPDRAAALKRLFEGIDRMNFRLDGPMPTREELHERR